MTTGWQVGEYEGAMVTGGAAMSSRNKGTPGMEVSFELAGHALKLEPYWLSEGAFDRSVNEMTSRLGFNNDFAKPEFSKPGPHKVELYEDKYNGSDGKERSTFKWRLAQAAGTPVPADRLAQLSAMAKARSAPPPPRPAGAPPAPPKPPAAPPAAPKAPPPAPTAPAPATTLKPATATRDQAWNGCWESNGQDNDKAGDEFAKSIAKVSQSSGKPESQFTDTEWGAVLADVIPI
jgi:hypothetical protein